MADEQDREASRKENVRYYMTKAIEAEEAAARAKNPAARDQFLKVAKSWRTLAETTERGS